MTHSQTIAKVFFRFNSLLLIPTTVVMVFVLIFFVVALVNGIKEATAILLAIILFY